PAAKALERVVRDPRLRQRGGQRVVIEVRQAPRLGDQANVRDCADAVRPQQLDEFVERSRRVTDGEDGALFCHLENKTLNRREAGPRSCLRTSTTPPLLCVSAFLTILLFWSPRASRESGLAWLCPPRASR